MSTLRTLRKRKRKFDFIDCSLTLILRIIFRLSFRTWIETFMNSPCPYADLSKEARKHTRPSVHRNGLSTDPSGPWENRNVSTTEANQIKVYKSVRLFTYFWLSMIVCCDCRMICHVNAWHWTAACVVAITKFSVLCFIDARWKFVG